MRRIVLLAACAFGGAADAAAPPTQRPAKLWTGTMEASKDQIWGFALAADGRTLVTTDHWRIAVWDLAAGRLLRERRYESGELSPHKAVFVRGGKEIASLNPNTVALADPRTLKTRVELKPNGRHGVSYVSASPCGALLAGARSETVVVWDAARAEVLWQKEFDLGDGSIRDVAFSRDGKTLAIGVYARRDGVWLLEAKTGRVLKRLSPRTRHGVDCLTFSPDGQRLFGASWGIIYDWNLADGTASNMAWPTKRHRRVMALDVSPDGKSVAAACAEDGLHVFEVVTGSIRRTLDGEPRHVAFCPGGRLAWSDESRRDRFHVTPWMTPAKARQRSTAELRRLWDGLGSDNAKAALGAMRELLGTPDQAVELLARLPRIPPVSQERLAKLVADLDDDDPDVRGRASEALSNLGSACENVLRAALREQPSLEVRKRIAKLLRPLGEVTPTRLRYIRGVEVLEALASPKAVAALENLASGAGAARESQDARAALSRLQKLADR